MKAWISLLDGVDYKAVMAVPKLTDMPRPDLEAAIKGAKATKQPLSNLEKRVNPVLEVNS